MNNLRQAAQQALEALEAMQSYAAAERKGLRICDEAIAALKQALAEPEQEPVAVKWTLNGDKHCRYDNWLGETPFGRILITWKSWKEFPEAYVDEFPGDFTAYGDPEKVKVECEAEFRRRIGAAPTPRKPLTKLEILAANKFMYNQHPCVYIQEDGEPENLIAFARAIERKHDIKE